MPGWQAMVDQTTPPKPPRRLWKVVFALSLALNLAVVGLVAGAALSGRDGDRGPRSFDLGVSPFARALAPEERRQIGRELRERRVLRDMNPRARVTEIVAVLTAEPFDPEALDALMSAQTSRLNAVQLELQEVFLAAIIAMPPERRQAFAARLEQELSRPRSFRERNP